MNRRYIYVLLIAFFIVISVLLLDVFRKSSNPNAVNIPNTTITGSDSEINTYEDCVAAGNPLLESYPPQCKTKSGKSFTQDIGNEFEMSEQIFINSPRPNTEVLSPLTITGKAVGSWYFEAVFPVKLVDANNKLIAQGQAQAKEDWMTEEFVVYNAELTFNKPDTKNRKTNIRERQSIRVA